MKIGALMLLGAYLILRLLGVKGPATPADLLLVSLMAAVTLGIYVWAFWPREEYSHKHSSTKKPR